MLQSNTTKQAQPAAPPQTTPVRRGQAPVRKTITEEELDTGLGTAPPIIPRECPAPPAPPPQTTPVRRGQAPVRKTITEEELDTGLGTAPPIISGEVPRPAP